MKTIMRDIPLTRYWSWFGGSTADPYSPDLGGSAEPASGAARVADVILGLLGAADAAVLNGFAAAAAAVGSILCEAQRA